MQFVWVGAQAVQGVPELLNVRTLDPVMATAMGVGAARHVIVAESLASASTLVPLSVPRHVLPAARIARVPQTRLLRLQRYRLSTDNNLNSLREVRVRSLEFTFWRLEESLNNEN